MTDPRAVSTDVAGVVQALSNGLRSELEIAKQARLPLPCSDCAGLPGCAPLCHQLPADIRHLFRLSDNGNDVLKVANAA